MPARATAGVAAAVAARRRGLRRRGATSPPPRRGELVRLLGEELRAREGRRSAALVTLEAGKISQEGLGEVQEMIDICDFAVGLSRQLYGLTIASERPGHRMMRDLAPARRRRRDHRLQLPGRGLGLERGARARLRRSGGVEAVRADAARRRSPRRRCSCARPARFGDAPDGLFELVIGGARPRGRSPTTRACRWSRATGSTRDGPRGRAARRRAASAARCSSSAATTR